MGKRLEQIFFQGGNADGQEAYEKMLYIISHCRNANQNHKKMSPHSCQNAYHQKEHK